MKKNKNIINFCGKPLISWSILQAKKSSMIKEVYISTDSSKIANPHHKYDSTGDYTVSLSIQNFFSGCSHTYSQPVYIRDPIADFTIELSSAHATVYTSPAIEDCPPKEVSFNFPT